MTTALRRSHIALAVLLVLGAGCFTAPVAKRHAGPWDLVALRQAPPATWGQRTNLVQEVYYAGEPWHGKPTRIFAYYARPEGEGPFPAMLLVHGGGGKAFAEWARHWAGQGYVALAMDLAGHGSDGRLPDGGPEQDDQTKFRDFTAAEVKEMWTYHAVAAVIRGHSLLAAQKEVDRNRIGITGISWGGYLTCIVAGLDDRLKVAVPVYGCGFLHEDSCWLGTFAKMNEPARKLWIDNFDPSQYLGGVNCPILFLNGSNDFAYPLDSYKKSYQLVNGRRTVSVKIQLRHGHIWTFGEVDGFVDSVLKGGALLPRVSAMRIANGAARATVASPVPVVKAEFHYTTDQGPWQKRVWQTAPAQLAGRKVSAVLPAARPLVCYLSVTDQRNLSVSTQHEELAAAMGK